MTQIAKAFTSSFQSEMRQYVEAVKTKADDVQRDIELVKAKTDRHEQKMQEKEREEASENRSLVVASLSKNWNQSSIIEFINNKQSPSEVVSFFFSRFDDSESLQCDTILRSLVFQLASRPSLTKSVGSKDLYSDLELAKDQDYSRDSLKKLFYRSLGLVEKWFIVLDGIDECDTEERRGLFGFLSDLLANENTSGKFPSPLHVVTGSKTTSQDILTYAEDILREKLSKGELNLGDINLAEEILRSISLKEQGMFLWAFLTIEDLCSRKCDADIIQALETLPSELNATLDRALDRILRHKNAEIAQNIFRWTAAVREPLEVDQLQEALSIKVGDKVIDPRSRINGIEKLTQWCENLVRIDEEDNAVCFSHHSILEYLSKTDSGPWKDFHIDHQEADHHVGQICLTYLNVQSPSTALQHTRNERPSDLFQRMNLSVITQQVTREFAPGGVRARAIKLMESATQLKETTNPSRLTGTQAVVDVKYPFTLIQFLTPESESYRLLVGMVEGSLLAHKMPWMDKKWQSSVNEAMITLFSFDLHRYEAPFYTIIYGNLSGNHDLICQAAKIIGRNPDLSNKLDKGWVRLLVEAGHLECPGNCVGKAQQYVDHYDIIQWATQHIADGVPNWPALVADPERPCNRPNYFMERGVSEDVHFVLVDGYKRSSRPLLQIFAKAYLGTLTKEGLDLLSQEFNLTVLDIFSARTVSGKSILDCQIEGKDSSVGYDHGEPFLLLDILGRENVTAHAREIGFGFDELRDLLTNGILCAYRNGSYDIGNHLSTIVQNLTLSESYRVTYNLSIFDGAERIIRENTYRLIQEAQAKRLVGFYLQSANRLAQFPEGSVLTNFEQTLKARNWILAKTLVLMHPQLAAASLKPVRVAFVAFLSCPQCNVVKDSISCQLTLCQPHHEQARTLSQLWVSPGKDSEDDECIDLPKQLAIKGSLLSYPGMSVQDG
ncbi:hypothetical protein HYE68_011111 [Fusarium pseudograminearum]|nr:hypothetical protein HYE68_011111 [Fusarium pseudograminearum]